MNDARPTYAVFTFPGDLLSGLDESYYPEEILDALPDLLADDLRVIIVPVGIVRITQ